MSAFTKSSYNATKSLSNAATATIVDAVSAAGGNWPNWVQDTVSDQSDRSAELQPDNKERVIDKEEGMASDMLPEDLPTEDGPTKADSEPLQEAGLRLESLIQRTFSDPLERLAALRSLQMWEEISNMDSKPHPGFDDWMKASFSQWKDERSGNEAQRDTSWEDDFAKHLGVKEEESQEAESVDWAKLQAMSSRHGDGTML